MGGYSQLEFLLYFLDIKFAGDIDQNDEAAVERAKAIGWNGFEVTVQRGDFIKGVGIDPLAFLIYGTGAGFAGKKLIEKGAVVKVYDPRAMENAKLNYFNDVPSIVYCKKNVDVLNNSDALILLTEWQEFRSPSLNLLKLKLKQPIIFDGRNWIKYDSLQRVEKVLIVQRQSVLQYQHL